ncbi:MAG TPA: ferritin-like domain-containing protein, partial [Anaerolineae bacterium]|nr:ferritin-like domain-containing protein [Anaerolineae bacterium]
MLLKQSMVDALNRQVNEEFSASAQYIAIALHFDSETLPQLAQYFHAQAVEEHGHAMKLLQYITDAGGKALVPATKEPKNHFETAEEPVQLALNQE